MAKQKQTLPPAEEWYTWKLFAKVPSVIDGQPDSGPRLLTPHADSLTYEFPFDLMFETPEQAEAALDDFDCRDEAEEEGWVLVKMTYVPVRRAYRSDSDS